MPVDGGPGLVEGVAVQLDLDGISELVPATIVAFLGPAILLLPQAGIPAAIEDELAGRVNGFLLVNQRDRLHALSGEVSTAGNHLAMRLKDEFRLGQRRRWSRADIALDARLVPQGSGPPQTQTTTLDISAGGVSVRLPDGVPVWPRYELTLAGGTLEAPVVAEAVPSRSTPEALGLRFSVIEAADRRRLVDLVLVVLNERAAGVGPD